MELLHFSSYGPDFWRTTSRHLLSNEIQPPPSFGRSVKRRPPIDKRYL